MIVGVVKEIREDEGRVALTPAGVMELVKRGHSVLVEKGAGLGSSISDEEYISSGASVIDNAEDVWYSAELILKVKEPLQPEYKYLRRGQVLFCYLHLAASSECTKALLEAGTTSIAFETVQTNDGKLPLLAPMSEIAGRMAPQVGAWCLERHVGGRGVLLGGVPGVRPAKVVVLGAGVAGVNAARIALGMGADVTVLDVNIDRLMWVDDVFGGRLKTLYSNAYAIEQECLEADLVIGAVLIPGSKAPKLVPKEVIKRMKPGSVLVDISVDQGGCIEGSRPTTHSNPVFTLYSSLLYCVANMPGAVPRTSTFALEHALLPFAIQLSDMGWQNAMRKSPELLRGLMTHAGALYSEPVAQAHGLVAHDPKELFD